MTKKGFSVIGIIGGCISVILSFVILGFDTGSLESFLTYGGDAYTGIQNAGAQTANNVYQLTKMVGFTAFSILLVIGILAICYFGYLYLSECDAQNNQHEDHPTHNVNSQSQVANADAQNSSVDTAN